MEKLPIHPISGMPCKPTPVFAPLPEAEHQAEMTRSPRGTYARQYREYEQARADEEARARPALLRKKSEEDIKARLRASNAAAAERRAREEEARRVKFEDLQVRAIEANRARRAAGAMVPLVIPESEEGRRIAARIDRERAEALESRVDVILARRQAQATNAADPQR
jgi:hypothetical protein